jgi:hypothetical protein
MWKHVITVYLFYQWYLNTNELTKSRAFVYSTLFLILEFLWNSFKIQTFDDEIEYSFKPHFSTSNIPSKESFVFIVLFSPIFINHFFSIAKTNIFIILMFPLNVWMCQIVKGYAFFYFYNKKVEPYVGEGTYFDGFVKFSRFKLWWLLGVVTGKKNFTIDFFKFIHFLILIQWLHFG